MNMSGWKTWTGAVLAFITAGLVASGYSEYAKILGIVAGTFGVVGVAHKIEKAGN